MWGIWAKELLPQALLNRHIWSHCEQLNLLYLCRLTTNSN